MTRGNAKVAGGIRHGGGNNCHVSSNNACVVGDIRYAGDRITDTGNCIHNVPIQRRPVTLATPPAAFVRPLQVNYYTAIAL